VAAAWNDVPATGGLSECTSLVRSAEALRTSAPELSVQLARRALLVGSSDLTTTTANTGEARSLAMRAQAVLAAGLVRISQHVGAVEPGFAALALAESGGALVLSAELRLDLAACAQDVGEPLLGGALLRPVLEAGQAPPSVRAGALGRLVGCVAHVARRDDVEDALAEADRLLAADDGLSPDVRRMERARLAVRSAAYHRWYGDNEDAVTAARDGLMLLDRLRRELRSESDRLRTRLRLELVCALLDEGELWEAEEAAHPTVDEPVRATSAASVGQLMLAVATRVHLPSGEVDRGRGLLAQAAWLAERHGQDSVLADALTELSRLDEQAGRVTDALEALRSARAAEQRRMRAVARAARHMLVQVGAANGGKDVTQQAAALLRQLAHPQGVPVAVAPPPTKRSALPPPRASQSSQASQEPSAPPPAEEPTQDTTDKDTGLLDREGLIRRLHSVRKGDRPVALTLVRFEPNKDNADPDTDDRGPDTGIMVGLADKVRGMAPEDAEVARSDGGELAVLLPHTTRDQAEEFAATIRETAMESDWLGDGSGKDMSISTGVVQSDPQTNTQVDAASLLTAARDALTPAPTAPRTELRTEPPPVPPTGEAPPPTLEDTKAALSTALSTPPDAAASPKSALTEDPPTTPLNMATTSDPRTGGRSILNSLSIPTGSGGRRRAAGGEPPPGEKPRRPTEPTEAARWTPTDGRVTDPAPTEQAAASTSTPEPSGWPAEPDISQPLRPPPAQPAAAETTSSTYDETRAELARMMSVLNAKARRSRNTDDTPNTPTGNELADTRTHAGEPHAPQTTVPTESESWPGQAAASDHSLTSFASEQAHPPATEAAVPRADHAATTPTHQAPTETPAFGEGHGFAAHHSTAARHAPAGPVEASAASERQGVPPHDSASAIEQYSAADLYGPASTYERFSSHAEGQDHTGAGEWHDLAGPAERHVARTVHAAGANDAASASAGERDVAGSGGWHGSTFAGAEPAAGAGERDLADDRRRDPAGSGGRHGSASAIEQFATGEQFDIAALADLLAPRQSIPTPPEPDEMPEPPSRPDIPEPPEPDLIPPAPPERPPVTPPEPGQTPQPGSDTRSRLMAAFDALTGPVPASPALDESRPAAETSEKPMFRVDFAKGTELPSRKPLRSWSELESASVVESPADGLFGAPAETRDKPSLGAAFGGFSTEQPEQPGQPEEPAGLSAVFEQRTSAGFVGDKPSQEPSVAERGPSGASAGLSATTYDHPIGPERRPEGLPRRGERSATTIASLLTEALAAYQATGDDENGGGPATPDRHDSILGDPSSAAGRHRSPE
jgi:GGDEF domain-containing protein